MLQITIERELDCTLPELFTTTLFEVKLLLASIFTTTATASVFIVRYVGGTVPMTRFREKSIGMLKISMS